MVAIGDNEPVFVSLHCILKSGRNKNIRLRWMGFGPGAEVGDHGKGVRAVHPVDADDIIAIQVRGNAGDQGVGGPAEEGNIYHSAALVPWARDSGRQAVGEETGFAALTVNSPDAAGERCGDIQVRAGSDGTTLELLQTCDQS